MSLEKENKRLREENIRLQKELAQKRSEEYCQLHGHDWYRHPYCGISDTNYLTCQRCGAQTTD